jgi:glycosyltransferase involved in cell wall biosynthesis
MPTTSAPPCPPVQEIAPADQLLVLPLPIRVVDGRVLYDLQSRDSLVRYLNDFDSVIVACPRLAESRVASSSLVWVPTDDLLDRVQFIPLPEYGSIAKFIRDYPATARLLRRCIDASRYLQFALGGGNGGLEHDWAAVGAELAIKAGRKFALLTDAVSAACYEMRADAARGFTALPRRLKFRLKARLVRSWQHRLIARCDLLFCNGLDTYRTFAPICRSPEVARKINDFQIGADKYLGEEDMERKCGDALLRTELRVCYAGRVEPQKAPLQWVRAIHEARTRGAAIRAIWLGDGSLLAEMRREVDRLELGDVVEVPGFVADRDRVIQTIRDADLMLFTHIEPESPRVLIEALMSACPIVGYDRPHPSDLISAHGGGELYPLGDWQALGGALAALATDRTRLVELIRRAWRDGGRFNSDIMSRDRCALIRARLDPSAALPDAPTSPTPNL